MESVQGTKKKRSFPKKTLQGLKSSLYKSCQKLPKPSLLRPFSRGSTRQRAHQADQCHNISHHDRETTDSDGKMPMNSALVKDQHWKGQGDRDVPSGSFMKFGRPNYLKDGSGKEKTVERRKSLSFRTAKGEGKRSEELIIEEKMRELEMMELGDLENVLDMEEALHCYSRLSSPVYLGIVESFLMDIYSDALVTQASASVSRSTKKRFGSNRM